LTPKGQAEALKANAFWASQLVEEKQAPPQSYYVSPLTRAMDTAHLTFSNLSLPHAYPFRPTVKELFREGISIHTCDRRSSKSYIHERYPSWTLEPGFAELDPLWNGTFSESSDAEDVRSRKALNELFESDQNQLISITAHSGEIASLLRVLGHRVFSLSTGQIIVTLVKADKIRTDPFPTTTAPWKFEATCTAPPVTSLAEEGCVCSSTATPTAV
jgi:broad specificity phosphatase PhoE